MASNVTRDHHTFTRDTVKNVSGDLTLDIVGDLSLDAGGGDIYLKNSGATFGQFVMNSLTTKVELDLANNKSFDVSAVHTTTSAGTYTGMLVDFGKSGSTADNTMHGLKVQATSTVMTEGENILYGIYCSPQLTHATDTGEPTIIGGYFAGLGGTNGTSVSVGVQIDQNPAWGDTTYGLQIRSAADTDDFFAISTGAAGATTISTEDDGGATAHLTLKPDGDVIIDRNVTTTTAGNYFGLDIDYDKTGTSTSGTNNLYGVRSVITNTTAEDGTNTAYGFFTTTQLTHAADAGTSTVIGGHFRAIGGTNGTSTTYGLKAVATGADTNYGIEINCADGGNDLRILSSADSTDYFQIATTAAGVTTISTVDTTVGATGHLTLDPDGDINLNAIADVNIPANIGLTFGDAGEKIEGDGTHLSISSSAYLKIDTVLGTDFQASAVGFTLGTPTYNASDTDVDFATSNKQFVTFDGGDITDLNLIFPKVSGNFLLMLKQDGTGSRAVTNYKVWDRNNATAASGSATVKFAGGSNPDLTDDANHVDIISFFYDDTNEIAYGVASLDFQF